jgi:tRNA A58 N-methylase Trm61
MARLYEKSEGVLTTAEVERLKQTFLDEYFRYSTVSRRDLRAGTELYAVESQFDRILSDFGDPREAIAALARVLELKL